MTDDASNHKTSKKIALIETGGTISTALDKNDNTLYKGKTNLIKSFKGFKFCSVTKPLCLLSEDFDFDDINTVITSVNDVLSQNQAEGIVITHGTDTLAYTATALALYFNNINIPIVLVSANYPLTNEKTNGFFNMNAATSFINSADFGGVFVAYKNDGEDYCKIHFGARLLSLTDFDGFALSPQNKICAKAEFVTAMAGQAGFEPTDTKVKFIEKPQSNGGGATLQKIDLPLLHTPNQSNAVLILTPYVGINYKRLAKSFIKNAGMQIIHTSYHSGTVKTLDGQNGSINDIKNTVYLTGGTSGAKYESQNKFNSNIKVFNNITHIALYFKLLFSQDMTVLQKKQYLLDNTANEYFDV